MRQWIRYGLFSAAILLIDGASKQWAISLEGMYYVNRFFVINPVLNRGVSWSLLHFESPLLFGLLTAFIAMITIGLCVYAFQRARAGYAVYAETAAIAGSISNLYDRILYGGVIDFIEIDFLGFVWPTFNFADVAIVLGVGWMLVSVIKNG